MHHSLPTSPLRRARRTAATLLLTGAAGPAWAGTLVVTTHDDRVDPTDGVCSLREAAATLLGAADPSCGTLTGTESVIALEGGSYCLESALSLAADVTVRGADDGTTVLDAGNGSGGTCATASGDRVVTVDVPAHVALQGLTVQGGWSSRAGGGVYAGESVSILLVAVQVRDNRVDAGAGAGGGGGVYVGAGGALTVEGGAVDGNSVDCGADQVANCARGGGIATDVGVTVNLVDTEVTGNEVYGASDVSKGGGLFLGSSEAAPSSAYVVRSTVAGNVVDGDGAAGALGGGIATEWCGELALDEAVIEDNAAAAGTVRAFGGGVAASFCGSVRVEDSTVRGNRIDVVGAGVGAYGGGLYTSSVGDVELTRSTFSGNEAVHAGPVESGSDAYGGGVYLHNEPASLVNVTLAGNRAEGRAGGYGGGLFAKGDVIAYVVHSTIAGNVATGVDGAFGGGLSHFPAGNAEARNEQVVLLSSVVADNVAEDAELLRGPDCYSTFYTLGHNLLGDATNCFLDASLADATVEDLLGGDAALLALADNGGSVETVALDTTSEARGLGACRDEAGSVLTTDARGRRRDTTCDAGAWEYRDRRSGLPTRIVPRTSRVTGDADGSTSGLAGADGPWRQEDDGATLAVGCSTSGGGGGFGGMAGVVLAALGLRRRRG